MSVLLHTSPGQGDKKWSTHWATPHHNEPVEPADESTLAASQDIPAQSQTLTQDGRRLEWEEADRSSGDSKGPRLTDAIRSLTDLNPTSEEELQALSNLVRLAETCQAEQATSTGHRPPDRLERLDALYKENVPGASSPDMRLRYATTLHALLEEDIRPSTLEWALRNSAVRDMGAQLVTSTVGYAGSFLTFNYLLTVMMNEEPDSLGAQVLAPAAVMTVSGLLAQRFLRTSEAMPGWKKTMELVKGKALPHIMTTTGALKVAVQYLPFLYSLLRASLFTPDPAGAKYPAEKLERSIDRVEVRMYHGFISTAMVALFRTLMFRQRDPVWLDASTPAKRKAMMGAIQELTGWRSTLTAPPRYLGRLVVAGTAGLVGADAHPLLDRVTGCGEEAVPPAVKVTGAFKGPIPTASRAALFFFPMLLFGLGRSLTKDYPENRDLINVMNDVVLIFAWGLAMSGMERVVAGDPDFKAEGAARGARQMAALARSAPPSRAVAPALAELSID